MTEILSIILLVFGILQIILFFNLWGMTNNIAKMRRMMEKKSSLADDAKQAMLNGQTKLAKKMLDKEMEVLKENLAGAEKNHYPTMIKYYKNQIEELNKVYAFYELEISE